MLTPSSKLQVQIQGSLQDSFQTQFKSPHPKEVLLLFLVPTLLQVFPSASHLVVDALGLRLHFLTSMPTHSHSREWTWSLMHRCVLNFL